MIQEKRNDDESYDDSKGVILIDDDVWIGHSAIILSGVHIGQGAVIGVGSVVSKDIPPYTIYTGGKIRRYRFNEDVIYRKTYNP